MSTVERARGGLEIEVVAKATPRAGIPGEPAVPACARWRLRLACRRALAVGARRG
jgi:hypothetical protein